MIGNVDLNPITIWTATEPVIIKKNLTIVAIDLGVAGNGTLY